MAKNMIEIIRPDYDRSKLGGKLLHPCDFTYAPIDVARGTWNLGDLLSMDAESIENMFTAYTNAQEREARKTLGWRAPAKKRKAVATA